MLLRSVAVKLNSLDGNCDNTPQYTRTIVFQNLKFNVIQQLSREFFDQNKDIGKFLSGQARYYISQLVTPIFAYKLLDDDYPFVSMTPTNVKQFVLCYDSFNKKKEAVPDKKVPHVSPPKNVLVDYVSSIIKETIVVIDEKNHMWKKEYSPQNIMDKYVSLDGWRDCDYFFFDYSKDVHYQLFSDLKAKKNVLYHDHCNVGLEIGFSRSCPDNSKILASNFDFRANFPSRDFIELRRKMNVDIIARFSNFIVIGEDNIKYLNYIRFLDSNRVNNIWYIGVNAVNINKEIGGSFEKGVPHLYIASDCQLVHYMHDHLGDAVFNTVLQHEMSSDYLQQLFPLAGYFTIDEIRSLGFLCPEIENSCLIDDKHYCLHKPISVKRNVSFLLRGEVVELRDKHKYAQDKVVRESFVRGFSVFRFKDSGYFKYECYSLHLHGYPKASHKHYHIVEISDTYSSVKLCKAPIEESLLCRLPRIFCRASIIPRVIEFTKQDITRFLDCLKFDDRVIDRGQFIFNCSSILPMYPQDAQSFSDCADADGLSWDDYCEKIFGCISLMSIKTSLDHLYRKDYVYHIGRKLYIDALLYKKMVNPNLLMSYIGCTPGAGGRNENDIYIFDGRQFRWPAYYFGK
jgi:hypothetical protein